MKETKVNLYEYQIKKLRMLGKTKKQINVRLSYDQISGTCKYKLLLTEAQKEKLDERKKLKKGLH
jgi:hypothetical protein